MPTTTRRSAKRTALDEVYARFARIWANSEPLVNVRALRAAIDALGVPPKDVSDDQLRSLNEDWVHGLSNRPFDDEALNRKYQRITTA
jgi:hypothetical protein